MSDLVEIVSAPDVWQQPTEELFEQAKASFLAHGQSDRLDLKDDMDDSEESPF